MKKAINLSAHLHIGNDPGAADQVGAALAAAFAATNPTLHLTVQSVAPPDAQGNSTARIHIEGEQDPAADFAKLTGDALHQAVASLNVPTARSLEATAAGGNRPPILLHQVSEDKSADDENTGVVLPPGRTIAGEKAAIAARAAVAAAVAVPTPTTSDLTTRAMPAASDTTHAGAAPTASKPAAPETAHASVPSTSPAVPAAHAAAAPDQPATPGRARNKGRKGGGPHRHSG